MCRRWLRVAVSVVVAGLGVCAAPATLPSTADTAATISAARGLLLAGHPELAESVVRQALPSAADAGLYSVLGEVLLRRAQLPQARQAYEEAVRINPAAAVAYLGLGRLAELEFRTPDARDP